MTLHAFFYKQHFYEQHQAEIQAKNQAKAKLLQFKIFHFLHPRYHLKIMEYILKKVQLSKCICFNDIIWLIIMKMKSKNRSHRYDINGPKHGHKYF